MSLKTIETGRLVEGSSFANSIKFPQGGIGNYKLVASVNGSGDLLLEIKTLAGSDATAEDFIPVNIGGTIRKITGPLSVTLAAATNWFNAGSTPLATKAINYFVYLGYNATDGVVIGPSRIPYARFYSDFSTTSTNNKYCKISTITNAAATDEYVNIGRFTATLSAGTGYTWSISGSGDIINKSIYETDILSVLPTVSEIDDGAGGQPTITNATYKITGDLMKIDIYIATATKAGSTNYFGMLYAPFVGGDIQQQNAILGQFRCKVSTNEYFGITYQSGNYFYGVIDTTITDNATVDLIGYSLFIKIR